MRKSCIGILPSCEANKCVQITLDQVTLKIDKCLLYCLLKSNSKKRHDQKFQQHSFTAKHEKNNVMLLEKQNLVDDVLCLRAVAQLMNKTQKLCEPIYSKVAHFETHFNPIHKKKTFSTHKMYKYLRKKKLSSYSNDFMEYTIVFNSLLKFPYTLSNLPLNAQLDLFIFSVDCGLLLGRTSFPLFGVNGILKVGSYLVPFVISTFRFYETLYELNVSKKKIIHFSLLDQLPFYCNSEHFLESSCSTFKDSYDTYITLGQHLMENASNQQHALRRCRDKVVDLLTHFRHTRLICKTSFPKNNKMLCLTGQCKVQWNHKAMSSSIIQKKKSNQYISLTSDFIDVEEINCPKKKFNFFEFLDENLLNTSLTDTCMQKHFFCYSRSNRNYSTLFQRQLNYSNTRFFYNKLFFLLKRPQNVWLYHLQEKFWRHFLNQIKQHILITTQCYHLLKNCLKKEECVIAKQRYLFFKRLYNKNKKKSLPFFGYLSLNISTCYFPLYFSPQHSSSFYPWINELFQTFHPYFEKQCMGQQLRQHITMQLQSFVKTKDPFVNLPQQTNESNSIDFKQYQLHLEQATCEWFLKSWTPLTFQVKQTLLQLCLSCEPFSEKFQTSFNESLFYSMIPKQLFPSPFILTKNKAIHNIEDETIKTLYTWTVHLLSIVEEPQQYISIFYDYLTKKKPCDSFTNFSLNDAYGMPPLPLSNFTLNTTRNTLPFDPYCTTYFHPKLKKNYTKEQFLKYVLELAMEPEPCVLTVKDHSLLWNCRYYLKKKKVGLLKLSCTVDSMLEKEKNVLKKQEIEQEFLSLLKTWPPLTIFSLLELLSPLCKNYHVRQKAVQALHDLKDNDLVEFFPQLIQALRYDHPKKETSSLLHFLIQRSLSSPLIACLVYWSLACESEKENYVNIYTWGHAFFKASFLSSTTNSLSKQIWNLLQLQKLFITELRYIATQVYGKWDRADSKTQRLQDLLENTQKTFLKEDSSYDIMSTSPFPNLFNKNDFIQKKKKTYFNLVHFPIPLPLPISPYYHTVGIVPQESCVLKSSQYPFLLTFRILVPPFTCSDSTYHSTTFFNESLKKKNKDHDWFMSEKELVQAGYTYQSKRYLYKTGDDLRQDQLVMQLLSILDSFLISYGFQYHLTKYNVMVLSKMDGFIEYIEQSQPLSFIKRTYPTLKHYFNLIHSEDKTKDTHQILNTFLQTCAASSVATFLLGVGDRHLDNLLISKNGCLFHVDFGFILGEDPKFFPAPMKLCKDIIDALGGPQSKGYQDFQLHCCQCFRCFRRHAKIIIDCLILMIHSGISALKRHPLEVIARVKEKFQLHVSELQAEAYLLNIISISASAFFPSVVDKFHEWAVYWK
jgi:hypothetical protein